jgi:hypothetical protein
MADAVRFIKISKKDKNGVDKTSTLQSLSELTIPYSTGNVRYNILNISEKPTYFLYEVNNPNLEWADRATIEYDFTGSLISNAISESNNYSLIPIINNLNDPLNFFNSTLQSYQINTYPQKDIYVEFSGSVFINKSGPSGIGTKSAIVGIALGIPNSPPASILNLTQSLVTGSDTTFFFRISTTIPSSSFEGRVGEFIFPYYDRNNPTPIPFDLAFGGNPALPQTPCFFKITSSISSGLALNTIPEPYFSEDFNRALDCQPLLNNAVNNRLSRFHQDIDYSSGLLTPSNFELLISGSALKASIQDSNYTLKRHTNPRYEGSRTTSQKLNEWTAGDINTYGKLPTTLTQDRVIYEFEFGGGTTPEILGWGGLKMSNLYLVNTPDSVRTIQSGVDSTTRVVRSTLPDGFTPGPGLSTYRKPAYVSQSFDEYYYTINKNNPVNHEITLFQYDPNPSNTAPSTTRVLTTDFSVPGVSNYAATSSNAKYGAITSGSNILKISSSVDIGSVGISGGAYSLIGSPTFSYAVQRNIWDTEQQQNDDRWFITLYNELEFPINNNTLEPYNVGFSASIDNVLTSPLASKGVFEILGIKIPLSASQNVDLVMSNTFTENKDIGSGSLGFLMWKAEKTGKHVLVQDQMSGVGTGAFTSRFTPEEITQNLTSITKEYGINKT